MNFISSFTNSFFSEEIDNINFCKPDNIRIQFTRCVLIGIFERPIESIHGWENMIEKVKNGLYSGFSSLSVILTTLAVWSSQEQKY